jgi:hydroxyacylglutathione hydrolase
MTFVRRRFARDNYLYLLAEGEDAVLVDPADPAVALDAARSAGVRPRWIVHTHGHADHSGGSARLREELGAEVIGHRDDAAWFAPDRDLSATPLLELGRLRIRVHPAPGHTPGSVLLEWRGRLLTGDTLFWSGCGNCRHGGDPALLAATFRTVLPPLDPRLEVHPGHDYAEANLPFVLDREPGNQAAAGRLSAVRAARAAGVEPEATELGEELLVNPFLRAGGDGAFVALRGLRDRW